MRTFDEMKKVEESKKPESIFSPFKKTPEQEERLSKLYYGKAYGNMSSVARGLGSFNLPKLHEAGVINLDDTIYKNLKAGKHHHGGGMFFAPDPVRIWRKHFGEDIFDKMENWRYDSGEDVFSWLERNNIEPVLKDGPQSATDYLHPIELQQNLADDLKAFNAYKNPDLEESKKYFGIDDPNRRFERITYHGENIQQMEQSLQRLDPDAYREYVSTKPKFDTKILPFKELNAEGGIVGLYI